MWEYTLCSNLSWSYGIYVHYVKRRGFITQQWACLFHERRGVSALSISITLYCGDQQCTKWVTSASQEHITNISITATWMYTCNWLRSFADIPCTLWVKKSFQNMTLHLKKYNIYYTYEINVLLPAIHSDKQTTADYIRICRKQKAESLKVVRGTPGLQKTV